MAILYYSIVGSVGVGVAMSVIMIVAGFLFCSVSAYMAGLVGSSNNPVSGITIATILFAALVLLGFLGKDSSIGPVAAVMIGAVVCCAACVAGDNLQDLKAGYLVGATPWRQQVMLAIGSISCALIMAPMLNMLAVSYGIGPRTAEHPQSLEAAQANLMASVANGMFGGHLPWGMIAIGAVIGVAIIIFDQILKARNAPFRVPVLAAAIGIYLPLETMVPIFLGGLLNYLVTRSFGPGLSEDEVEKRNRKGTLFAAGLITGEALMGIFIGAAIYFSKAARSARAARGRAGAGALGEWVGLAVLGVVGFWMYRVGKRGPRTDIPDLLQGTRLKVRRLRICKRCVRRRTAPHFPSGTMTPPIPRIARSSSSASPSSISSGVRPTWSRASACTRCRRSCSAASASSARESCSGLVALALGRRFELDATEWRHMFVVARRQRGDRQRRDQRGHAARGLEPDRDPQRLRGAVDRAARDARPARACARPPHAHRPHHRLSPARRSSSGRAAALQASHFGYQLLILVAVFAWSVSTVYIRNVHSKLDVLSFTAVQMLLGGIMLTALGFATGEAGAMALVEARAHRDGVSHARELVPRVHRVRVARARTPRPRWSAPTAT